MWTPPPNRICATPHRRADRVEKAANGMALAFELFFVAPAVFTPPLFVRENKRADAAAKRRAHFPRPVFAASW